MNTSSPNTQQLGPNSTMTPPGRAYQEHILNEIEANRSIYIEFLQSFVGAASPNPPGDTRAASEVIKTFLSRNDVRPITIAPLAHAINVFASFNGEQGNGRRVLFNGHIDTFPLNDDTTRLFPPCSGLNDGERIHGLGAVGMKAGTAASVIAFTILKKWSSHLTGSVALMAVSDKESGARYGTQYLLELWGDSLNADYCVINGEPGGLQSVRFGEKGERCRIC
jgi:succinyl-diaminopimelate desuccinylase